MAAGAATANATRKAAGAAAIEMRSDTRPSSHPRRGALRPATDRLRLTFLDFLILAIAASAFALSAVSVYGGAAPTRVVVSSERGEWIYPLSGERVVPIDGPLGQTVIEIRNGKAGIIGSPCRNKTCIAAGHIGRAGEWVACLPNGVFLRVEGDAADDDELDAVVR